MGSTAFYFSIGIFVEIIVAIIATIKLIAAIIVAISTLTVKELMTIEIDIPKITELM